jgi:hypothetical protein
MLTGIEVGYEPEELFKIIQDQNRQLVKEIGEEDFKKGFQYVARRKCRNRQRENWIYKATPRVYKALMKAETVNVDLVRIFVEEDVQVTRCYNCNGFGHVGKQKRPQDKRVHGKDPGLSQLQKAKP